MKKMTVVATVLAVIISAVGTLHAAVTKSTMKSSFPRPAAGSSKALKATVGKEFSAGYVFVDGKYLPPPYQVNRVGSVIRINGVQVTFEVVPWSEFVQTQEGVTVTKKEIMPAEGATTAEPEPEAEPEVEEEEEDDDMSSLDDLFDDEPSEKKKAKKPAKKKKAYKPKPAGPRTVVTYSFEGEFKPNAKSKLLVDKVNQTRLDIDRKLRNGGAMFFGARYGNMGRLELTPAPAKAMMEKLPDIMKGSSTQAVFEAACRQAGYSYFTQAMLSDLFKSRLQYQQLIERRKQDSNKNPWD